MRSIASTVWVCGLMLLSWPAGAVAAEPARSEIRPSKAALRQELIAVVEAQLKAFRAGDYAAAYALAARELRQQMTEAQFTALVQTGYPVIATNTGADFGVAKDDGGRAVLSVAVNSPEATRSFTYLLQKEAGGWRIAGVVAETSQPKNTV